MLKLLVATKESFRNCTTVLTDIVVAYSSFSVRA